MKTTLLTAVGSASAAAALKSLRALGHRVIGCDIYPQAWNIVSGEVDAFFQALPVTDEAAYVNQMMDAVEREHVDYLIPLTDLEVDVLCACKANFASLGCTVCTPDEPAARLCRDKMKIAQVLAEDGICRTIPTRSPYGWEPAESDFPLMLKPIHGRSSQGQAIVRTKEAFDSALKNRSDYIAQPFIEGDIFTVDVARDLYGNVCCLPRQELLRTVNGLGTTVRTCPGHPLEKLCAAIAARAQIVGVVNMEFIVRGDEYWFLEVNPRFSGGMGFSLAAGADFAAMQIACHDGDFLAPLAPLSPMTLTRRVEMVVTEK
ncbi:MAG: ATP-grasp domain-containing protein [Clostridia bacterium]|nr:ATP-grasp domain-containing protein [Clostridia bacterium]